MQVLSHSRIPLGLCWNVNNGGGGGGGGGVIAHFGGYGPILPSIMGKKWWISQLCC